MGGGPDGAAIAFMRAAGRPRGAWVASPHAPSGTRGPGLELGAEPRSTRSRWLPRDRSRLPWREPRLGMEDRQRVRGGATVAGTVRFLRRAWSLVAAGHAQATAAGMRPIPERVRVSLIATCWLLGAHAACSLLGAAVLAAG